MRNWSQPAIPYAAFIAAYLIKLNEGQKSLADLRVYLTEHPELIWLLGFPLAVSYPARLVFDPDASLPTSRHLTRMLREIPNPVLQVLLGDSVRLIREALAFQGIQTADGISLDTKHVIAVTMHDDHQQQIKKGLHQPPIQLRIQILKQWTDKPVAQVCGHFRLMLRPLTICML